MAADENNPDDKKPQDGAGEAKSGDSAAQPGGPAPAKPAPPKPLPPRPETPAAKPAPPRPAAPPAAKPATPSSPAAGAAQGATPAPPKPPAEDPMRRPVPSLPLDRLKERYSEAIEEVVFFAGEVSVRVKSDRLEEIARFLKTDDQCRLTLLSDLCATDFPKDERRFEINYHLYSIPLKQRLRLKVRVADGGSVATVSTVWATANWHEREAFDLFGIGFTGHPDLTRILLPDDWRGHPLRKEYPLEGFADQHPRYR